MSKLLQVLPGLIFVTALAAIAIQLARVPAIEDSLHVSALLIVILLGIAWRSFLPIPNAFQEGIKLAQKPLLRWGVAGLGFKLSIAKLYSIGGSALAIVAVSTVLSLIFGWWVAKRLGLPEKLGLLLGVGGSICGASAIVAADSVVQSEKAESAAALGVVTLLGTIGILLYPWLFHLLAMNELVYGVWTGSSLHETAQVVAAGLSVGEYANEVATVSKLARILLLAPIVFYLAAMFRRKHAGIAGETKVPLVPWFLVMFVVFAAFNSLVGMGSGAWQETAQRFIRLAVEATAWILAMGMAGVGLQAGFKDLRQAGLKPVLVGLIQWVFLAAVSLLLSIWLLGGA